MATEVVKRKPVFTTIDALRPDTSGHNLTVKVLDAKVVLDRPGRPGAQPQRIAECTVGDATGIILFTARNEQVDLMKAGSFVVLRNAKIDMFRGSMRLAVNRWGKIEAAPEGTAFEVKTDHNLSLVEYELVQVPAEASGAAAPVAAAAPAPASEPAAAAEPAASS